MRWTSRRFQNAEHSCTVLPVRESVFSLVLLVSLDRDSGLVPISAATSFFEWGIS
jgi:hypothetical protein